MRNGFCFLTDTLPRSISKNKKAIALDTTTSSAIAVILYFDENHSPAERAEYACLKLFHKSLEEVLKETGFTELEIFQKIVFYLSGYPKAHKISQSEENPATTKSSGNKHQSISFDYIQDSDAILSAFRQVYGMTLEEVKNLHWWEFSALLENLSDQNCAFVYKVATRQEKIPAKASPEQKLAIQRRKRAVALVDTRTQEEKQAQGQRDLQNAFKDW